MQAQNKKQAETIGTPATSEPAKRGRPKTSTLSPARQRAQASAAYRRRRNEAMSEGLLILTNLIGLDERPEFIRFHLARAVLLLRGAPERDAELAAKAKELVAEEIARYEAIKLETYELNN